MERLPGFRDFYPEPLPFRDAWSAARRSELFASWRNTARRYGFVEYDGPPLEPLELFTTKSGEEIVGQLYNFTDKGGREVALRPEMTPTLARMAAAAERAYKKPLKWFAIPQLFRYERQQKGRLREHFQFNADIIGEAAPAADAELIALLIDSLRDLGLTAEDFVVRLSSRQAWQTFYRSHIGHPGREYAFFQVVDKLEREPEERSREKLAELGGDLEAVRAFIQRAEPSEDLQPILEDLEARGLEEFVQVDYRIVRGLAYYTGPVFEAFDRQGQFRAIAGGGRYDNLLKLVSGGKVDLPALGFGMGDVVLTELLKARHRLPKAQSRLEVGVLIEEETYRPETLRLVQDLRQAGLRADFPLAPTKSDRQFKRFVEEGAAYTVRLTRDGQGGVQAIVRCLADRSETTLPPSRVAEHIRASLPRDAG